MAANMSSITSLTPDVAIVDDLELLRNGVLGEQRVGPGELVTLPLTAGEVPERAAAVQVTDAEGVPLAQLPLVDRPGLGPVVRGEPVWQGRRSTRPFEQLHLRPDQVSPVDTVVVVDTGGDPDDLFLPTPTGALLILVLASTEDGGPAETAVIGSACALAASRPRTTVIVVPLHPRAARWLEKKERIVAAYARGTDVVDLTSSEGVQPARPEGEGAVLFFTGLSGSGKSTIARSVRNWLIEHGRTVTFLDGDLVRRHLSAGLGFTAADRDRNIRRIGWVAAEVAGHGGVAICSPIAPYERTRAEVREMVRRRGGRFVLIHVATPLEECERRDRKGLYARARRGEIPDFTGISAPYEEPTSPDLRVDTTGADLEEVRDSVLTLLALTPAKEPATP